MWQLVLQGGLTMIAFCSAGWFGHWIQVAWSRVPESPVVENRCASVVEILVGACSFSVEENVFLVWQLPSGDGQGLF